MSGVSSSVHICNLALDHLKEDSITTIDPPVTKVEVICARWYDHVRKSVLRKHSWNFAIKRASLAELSDTPSFQYSKQFQLPSNYIRLMSIGEFGSQKRYEIEDGKILTDDIVSVTSSGALPIRYIYDFTNVSQMDPLFIDLLAAELALKISYQITGSNTRGRELFGLIKDIAPEAYAIDGQERPPIRREQSNFKRKRRGMQNTSASPYTIAEDY
jgi:hypothetical protein